ncbi:MAG: 4-alpha-glucanotransferase [Planctomycetes bacterium]|nr:4-alpha-glucanotransferase [Planctomycetota bacterium]
MADQHEGLCRLAEYCGIEKGYYDAVGKWVQSSEEAFIAILNQLDIPINSPDEAPHFLHSKSLCDCSKPLEPVSVSWFSAEQGYAEIPLLLPKDSFQGLCKARLDLENGTQISWEFSTFELIVSSTKSVFDKEYVTLQIEVPQKIPLGCHVFYLEGPFGNFQSALLAAPKRAHGATLEPDQKNWGVFLPLYAAKSDRNLGAGDFTDLEKLIEWTAKQGGKVVGTLPMLSAFLDKPCEISPYSPASRLFWNEFYLDVERIAEFEYSPDARKLFNSPEFQREAKSLRELDLVDYPKVMKLKRKILELLVLDFLQTSNPVRKAALDAYIAKRPEILDFALFRANIEKYKSSWHTWPTELNAGALNDNDVDPLVRHYYILSQWWAEEQITNVSEKALHFGAKGLYLDLPLGVNADSYDVYRHRELFAMGASGGAPPDSFFTLGQDWGFPPLRPDKLLENKLTYLRSCLSHHMKHCSMLRVDHVMGLHRLYWVPKGLGAKNGAYVRYNSEAMYAIFNLESHKHKTLIIGEDLGTVPPAVRPMMKNHGWHRLCVGQFEINPKPGRVLNETPEGAVASINTHDLPTFASYWLGTDIDERVEMGLLTEEEAKQESNARKMMREAVLEGIGEENCGEITGEDQEKQMQRVLESIFDELAQSQAGTVLVNLEDAWFCREPQNVPGTWKEKPNWMHKSRYSNQELDSVAYLKWIVKKINNVRNR